VGHQTQPCYLYKGKGENFANGGQDQKPALGTLIKTFESSVNKESGGGSWKEYGTRGETVLIVNTTGSRFKKFHRTAKREMGKEDLILM